MTEWIVSSSVLIVAIMLVRALFKGKISLRLQYGLWGLVLLRLLIPVNFGASAVSVGNLNTVVASQPVVQQVIELGNTAVAQPSYEEAYHQVAQRYESQGISVSQLKETEQVTFDAEVTEQMQGKPLGELVADVAFILWIAGGTVVAGVLVVSNLRFRKRLMGSRVRLYDVESPLPVYLSDQIETPCLFGAVKSAIYVTEQAVECDSVLRHTIAHESTHYRHGDHIWAIARCVCLVVHWYNPLVWAAAFLSRRDGELACDEATIKRLGEEERAAYGRTLIGMTCRKGANLLVASTTMTASKRGLKERILLIAKRPKMAIYTLVAVLVIAAVCVGCTFTGAQNKGSNESSDETVSSNVVEDQYYGTSVFKDGDVTGMTVRFGNEDEIAVKEDKLEEYVKWAKGFSYGGMVARDSLVDACTITLYYSDGSKVSSGLDRIVLNDTVYEVERERCPLDWNELFLNSIELIDIYDNGVIKTFNDGAVSLYEYNEPNMVCIWVFPTEYGYPIPEDGYLIPADQPAFVAAYKKAMAAAKEQDTKWRPSKGWRICYQGDNWWVEEDGGLRGYDIYIAPEDAAELVSMCAAAVDLIGLEPVQPGDLNGIERIYFSRNNVTYEVTNRQLLRRVEQCLMNSSSFAGGSCFFDIITLEFEDGRQESIAVAADGCTGWVSNGQFYDYSGEPFYEQLLEAGEIVDIGQTAIETISSIHWGVYADAYGMEMVLERMELLRQWVAEEPSAVRIKTAFYACNGLDERMSAEFGALLADIYELDKDLFSVVCLDALIGERQAAVIQLLAEHWGTTDIEVHNEMSLRYRSQVWVPGGDTGLDG